MHYDMRTMKAFGLHTSNRPATPEQSDSQVGLHTLVYRSPEDAYVQNIAPDGRFIGFAPFRPCTTADYTPAHLPICPQLGDPHLLALISDPANPGEIDVMAWPAMFYTVVERYEKMRPALLKDPVAGFRLANFVLGLAPSYANAPGSHEKIDRAPYALELERIAADRAHIYERSAAVQELARQAGRDINPPPGGPSIRP